MFLKVIFFKEFGFFSDKLACFFRPEFQAILYSRQSSLPGRFKHES